MAPGPDLRVGDAERDATAERLRENYAQGRLTLDEFNERLSAALAAITERDLSRLTSDLPAAAPSPPLPRSVQSDGWQRSGYQGGRRARGPHFSPVFAVLALAWVLIYALPTFRFFPLPGKLAIILVIVGIARGPAAPDLAPFLTIKRHQPTPARLRPAGPWPWPGYALAGILSGTTR